MICPSVADLAYAAGFFDGEGCVRISKRKRGKNQLEYTELISIGNTDHDTLEWFAMMFGGKVGHERKGVNKPIKYWKLTNAMAVNFLQQVRPWLRTKAAQADVVISASVALRGELRKGMGRNPDYMKYEHWETAKIAVTQLKKGGV